jgi:hypothetical protein
MIPVHTHHFPAGLYSNRPETNPKHGSSIPTGISPYRNQTISKSFLLPGSQRNIAISSRKPSELPRIQLEQTGKHSVFGTNKSIETESFIPGFLFDFLPV